MLYKMVYCPVGTELEKQVTDDTLLPALSHKYSKTLTEIPLINQLLKGLLKYYWRFQPLF